MKRFTLIGLVLFVLCQLSLPKNFTHRLHSIVIASFSLPWEGLSRFKGRLFEGPSYKKKIEKLEIENYQLRSQAEVLKAYLGLQEYIDQKEEEVKQPMTAYGKRRQREIFKLMNLYTEASVGRVIFREPSCWANSFWIDLGKESNLLGDRGVVAKNSPVVLGNSLVGLVEYVDTHRSRVRLITDPTVVPSVRAIRGGRRSGLPRFR